MAKKQKFVSEEWVHYSRLGRRRKKLIKYRKARGRDNKVRLHMKGHLRNVEIGYKGEKSKRGLIEGKMPVLVYNLNDIAKLKQKEIGILGKIGNKKRAGIADYCLKNKIKLLNLNPEKFLAKIADEKKQKEEKVKSQEKRKEKEKKTKKEDKKEKTEEKKEETQNAKEENTEDKK